MAGRRVEYNLAERVEVRKCSLGNGVFALRRFRKNQVIGEVRGEVITEEGYGSTYCMDLGGGRLLEPGAPFRFVNHSCEPNAQLFYWDYGSPAEPLDRLWLQALRTIQPEEQLTIDYKWPADAAIPCGCGSPNCRGWVVCPTELHLLKRRKRASA